MNSFASQAKWKVFREKVPEDMVPLWVVWSETEEFLFQKGADALDFVKKAINHRAHNHDLSWCPEAIVDGKVVGRCLID